MKEPQKKSKFSFEEMKAAATSNDAVTRKNVFIEYFERFGEFPSYLFDNDPEVDSRLAQTIEDLKKSPEATEAMQKGLKVLLSRLPSRDIAQTENV